MVKAALATALEYDGKTLQDMERDILKQAKEEEKKQDKPKSRLGVFAPLALAGSATKATINGMGNSAITLGETAAKFDRGMSDADKPLDAMAARTKMLHRAIEDLQARHPHLS